jgi:hypothetical protein
MDHPACPRCHSIALEREKLFDNACLACCRLRIFDISCRLLKNFKELPGEINIAGLAPGILIQQLSNCSGSLV